MEGFMKKLIKKILISFGVFSLLFVGGCQSKEEPKEVVQIRANSTYAAPKNPTQEMTLVYNDLTDAVLGTADDTTKASLVASVFAYDFFTLYNKDSATDIGGMVYIPTSMQEEFQTFAAAWFYQNYDVITNLYGKEELPYVISHEIKSTTPEQVVFKQNTYNGYRVNLTLTYKKSSIETKLLKTNLEVVLIYVDGEFRVKEIV